VVQATVAPADWDKLRPVLEAGRPRPLLEAVFAADAAGADSKLLGKLQTAAPGARSRLIEDAIQAEIATLLGRPDGSRMDRDLGFFNAGMDSLTSIDLRGRLEKRLGVTLSPTVAFEHPTIAALAGYVLGELFSEAEPANSAPEQPKEPSQDQEVQLDDMSEDDLAALLTAELRKESPYDHG
jgi:acyl carrier protein